ncbi:MAG: hypothetical protein HOQ22_17240, partial [Nocardioidaceae bacterium]|nr:hypothetical protein [Nocardioidaceae bacterium]
MHSIQLDLARTETARRIADARRRLVQAGHCRHSRLAVRCRGGHTTAAGLGTMTIAAGNIGCPFCRAQLDYEGTVCGDCGASVVARGPLAHRTEVRVTGRRVRLAVTRRSWDGEELLVWRDGPRGLRFRRPKGRRRPAADDEG